MSQDKEKGRKPFKIIVNGREKEWSDKAISFRQVVELAFGVFEENELIVYTATFKPAEPSQREGTMVDGDEVKVHPGMIFNVTRTDKS